MTILGIQNGNKNDFLIEEEKITIKSFTMFFISYLLKDMQQVYAHTPGKHVSSKYTKGGDSMLYTLEHPKYPSAAVDISYINHPILIIKNRGK